MKKNNPQTLIIKKYENRRLYNTLTSQYINQEQVAQLVRDGHDVRVVDAATGEDLTRLILAQIVLEDAKTPDSVFPLDVLRQMIVASGTGHAGERSALHESDDGHVPECLSRFAVADEPFRTDAGTLGPACRLRRALRSRFAGQPRSRGNREPSAGDVRKPGRKPPTWTNSRGASRSWKPCLSKRGRRKRRTPENKISPQVLTHCGKRTTLICLAAPSHRLI